MRPTSSLRARLAVVASCVAALAACTSPERRADAASASAAATSTVVASDASVAEVGAPADAAPPSAPAAALADALPRLASGAAPAYPRLSRRLGEEGWVDVAIDVRQDGEVVGLAIVGSSGAERLEQAALAAARTWRFYPRTGPRGVDRLAHRIVFRLQRDPPPR